MNVKGVNDNSYRSLMLLEELSRDDSVSQRDLSKRLGIALGLVNSYVKNMIAKGYIRVSSFPRNRYKYLLTPKGIAEKTRLTYQHLHYFASLYTTARQDFRNLFSAMEREGGGGVVFCGVDEVAEIAYLSLQETNLRLVSVVDDEYKDKRFFTYNVTSIEDVKNVDYHSIVITSLKKDFVLTEKLKKIGVTKFYNLKEIGR